MSRRKRLTAATLAAVIVLAIASGLATMAIPIDTLSPGGVVAPIAKAPTTTTPAVPAAEGGFTGQYVNGVAVYRLPSIDVVASGKAELAKMEAEERLAGWAEGLAPSGADAWQEPTSMVAVLTWLQ